jgi:3-hydroxybutyryl-CoA dehydrogenase
MVKKVAVIGAGTMGNGIAHVFALHQYPVVMVDISEEQIDKALGVISRNLDRMLQKDRISSEDKIKTLLNITSSTDLPAAVEDVDLVIEAVSENEDLKKKIFSQLSAYCKPGCILATNTSSISITRLASGVTHPERVIGMHFMNPVPMMQLIEVIRGHQTSDAVTRTVMEMGKKLDKTPVEVRDYPGFISNRILMPMINEAIWALHEGVADNQAIDTILKLGMGHPMGPLELADFIGLDVCLAILMVLYQGYGNPKYAPCPLLVNMVHAGLLGRKSGEGFYRYG